MKIFWATIAIAVLAVSILGYVHYSRLGEYRKQARVALDSVRAVHSAVKSGVKRDDYHQRVIAARVAVEKFLSDQPAELVPMSQEPLKKAISLYLSADEWWSLARDDFVSEVPIKGDVKKILAQYPEMKTTVEATAYYSGYNDGGDFYQVKDGLSWFWDQASSQVADSERRLQ